MNISLTEVFNAVQSNNENTGGAYIDKNPNAWFIRTEGLARSIPDIEKIVVKNTSNGTPILVEDVAEVKLGHAIRYGAMTRNQDGEVVGAIVMMLKGENSNEVIGNIKDKIETIKSTLPEGVEIEPFLDRTNLVDRAITTVSTNLVEGALIVIFVLVLFLGNFRAGLVVASVIPLAMLFAVSMMNLFGVSGNLMSLGAIDFGLIIDGAVIIVEATLHHIVSKRFTKRLTQSEMDEEVYESASKIRSSAAFGELIILIVYLPILALVGVEGKMFAPMAQTVIFAIMGAFILSLTYVPMISALMLSKKTDHKKNISDKMMDRLNQWYLPIIKWAIESKKIVIGTAIGLLLVSVFVFTTMGGEFIPSLDEGDFAVETRVMTGSSMQQTVDAALSAGEILTKEFPDEVKLVVGKIGSSEIPTDPMPIEACDMMIILKDKDNWTKASDKDELANKMQKALENIPGVNFGFQQPIQMRFNELMTGARQDVAIKIYGEDLDVLAQEAKKLGAIIQPIEGAKDLYIEEVTGLPQIVVRFDREKVAHFGLNIEEMNRMVSMAFAGSSTGLVYEGEKRYDLVVRLKEENRQNIQDVQNLFVTTSTGNHIPLTQVADVKFEVGPNQIQRDDAKRRITVAFNVRDRDVQSIVDEIKQKVEGNLKLPAGYYLTYGGQFKNLVEAKTRLSIAVPIALLLILVLLYFTFHSIKQSVLIFSAIPLSAIGGIFALWLRDMPFSISAGVGFIALFGVAVLNGIVLIAEFNHLKSQGMKDLKEIIIKGTQTRLRPVLMTATVASLGFLPMALSHGSGAEVQKPLATVVIGGLLSATLLTLLVLPVLYLLFEKKVKVNPLLTAALPIFLLFVGSQSIQAQNSRAISLEEATQLALQKNGKIKAADYTIEYNQHLRATSTDIGKTSVSVMYGQFNSYYKDNSFTLSQSLPFPTTMRKQAQLYDATKKGAEYNKLQVENDLLYQVKTCYNQLQVVKAKRTLLNKQDSIYVDFLNSASLRFKTGESSILEKASAESQLYELRTLKVQNEGLIRIYEKQLQALLNVDEIVTSQNQDLEKITLSLTSDSLEVSSNPSLQFFKHQIYIAECNKELEKSKLLPDINLGYFNQSLYGTVNYQDPLMVSGANNRFQGVNVGVSFPLWAKPQLERIKANEAQKNSLSETYKQYEKELNSSYQQAFQSYQSFQNSLDYFEKNALSTAKIIEVNATKNYKSGNIGYIEFSQGLNRVLSIQNQYLETLAQYNQAIFDIEFLIGNK
jgi:heavy metal efflux system protein